MDEIRPPSLKTPPGLLRAQQVARELADSMAPAVRAAEDASAALAPALHAADVASASERSIRRTFDLIAEQERSERQRHRAMSEATVASSELLSALVQHAVDANDRERKMLWWSRVSGIAAIAASVLAVIAIAVTFLVA